MDIQYLTALCLSSAGVALCYSILLGYSGLGRMASAVIAISLGMITLFYLQDHPQVLASAAERIALSIIEAVVAMALFTRKRAGG